MEEIIDRDYYIAGICEDFPCGDEIEVEDYFKAVNKAIDKTLESYARNGKVSVEDWDMFDQDLYMNVDKELDKLYE